MTVCASLRAGVNAARPNQPIVVMLFDDVRTPATDARTREDGCVQFRRDAEQIKHRSGIEIQVGAKMLLALHHRFESFANRYPIRLATTLPELARKLPHHWHARIARFVNTMAEAHDLFFAR